MKKILYDHDFFEVFVDENNYVTVCQKKEACCVLPISKDKEILLIKIYRHGFLDYVWEAIKGFVEDNETIEKACIREIKEETDLDVDQIKFISYISQDAGVVKGKVGLALALNVEKKQFVPQVEEEIVACKWVKFEEFEKMINKNEIKDLFTQLLYYKAKELKIL